MRPIQSLNKIFFFKKNPTTIRITYHNNKNKCKANY